VKRGVDVYLLLSNTRSDYTNGWPPAQTARAIRDIAVEMEGAGIVDVLCTKLHVAGARDVSGGLVPNHAKVVIADESTFYVGSQNLYPGGLSDAVIPELSEFGYIVDDANVTKAFISRYWEPNWGASQARAISGGGPGPSCVLSGGPRATNADCATGWQPCGAGRVCSWNGGASGYCCKKAWSGTQSCVSESDASCGEGICSRAVEGQLGVFYCTKPDVQPCL
jgi:hypothetical protein